MDNITIELKVDKEPYIKHITDDKVINITGESGSGKTYYTQQYINNDSYVIVDTDEVFARFETSNGINRILGNYFRNKYKTIPNICEDFEFIYEEILDYFKDSDKTIIIDSAQFRNLKDVNKLKGTIIILRTSVNTCYQRCVDRYKSNHLNATEEEIEKYSIKKRAIYEWYKGLNDFILRVDKL